METSPKKIKFRSDSEFLIEMARQGMIPSQDIIKQLGIPSMLMQQEGTQHTHTFDTQLLNMQFRQQAENMQRQMRQNALLSSLTLPSLSLLPDDRENIEKHLAWDESLHHRLWERLQKWDRTEAVASVVVVLWYLWSLMT